MKTIFVLTSQYMPLIANEDPSRPSERVRKNDKLMHTQDITVELITQTLVNSKSSMLAFESKKAAAAAMAIGLKRKDTADYYIDGTIPYFAVPLIFTVQVNDDFAFEDSKDLTGEMLYSYLQTNSIPFFNGCVEQGVWKDPTIHALDALITEQIGSRPKVFTIDQTDVAKSITTVFYLAANPPREAEVKWSTAKQDLEKIKQKEAPPEGSSTSCSMM